MLFSRKKRDIDKALVASIHPKRHIKLYGIYINLELIQIRTTTLTHGGHAYGARRLSLH